MHLRLLYVCQAVLGLLLVSGLFGKSEGKLSGRKPGELFRPYLGEKATLSRDGEHLAFLRHDRPRLTLVIHSVHPVSTQIVEIPLEEPALSEVESVHWVSEDSLVVSASQGSLYLVSLVARTARRVLDSTSFADVSGEKPYPRRPRLIGQASDAPLTLWIEGVSYVAQEAPLELPSDDAAEPSDPAADAAADMVAPEVIPPSGDLELDRLNGFTQQVQLYQFNLATGELRSRSRLEDKVNALYLYDQQGNPRLRLNRSQNPQQFFLLARERSLFARSPSLDRWLGNDSRHSFTVTPKTYLGRRAFPLGFAADPETLYFASNTEHDGYGIYTLDLRSKAITQIAPAPAGFDLADFRTPFSTDCLVTDRKSGQVVGIRQVLHQPRTAWLDSALAKMDQTLQRKFPQRTVEIVEWNDSRSRVLVRVSSDRDPGRLFIYFPDSERCLECVRQAPWLPLTENHFVQTIDETAPDGRRITGRLTVPRITVLARPPLVIWLHDGPWERNSPHFSPEAQAFADLGFLVLQLDYQGSAGLGGQHRLAIEGRPNEGPIDDALAALNWVSKAHAFDPRRVAVVGVGYGGYTALRAVATQPSRFRCAVSINAPADLGPFSEASTAQREIEQQALLNYTDAVTAALARPSAGAMKLPNIGKTSFQAFNLDLSFRSEFFKPTREAGPRLSLPKALAASKKDVLLLHDPQHPRFALNKAQAFRKEVNRAGGSIQIHEVHGSASGLSLSARGAITERAAEFLADQLYAFEVEIGESRSR